MFGSIQILSLAIFPTWFCKVLVHILATMAKKVLKKTHFFGHFLAVNMLLWPCFQPTRPQKCLILITLVPTHDKIIGAPNTTPNPPPFIDTNEVYKGWKMHFFLLNKNKLRQTSFIFFLPCKRFLSTLKFPAKKWYIQYFAEYLVKKSSLQNFLFTIFPANIVCEFARINEVWGLPYPISNF